MGFDVVEGKFRIELHDEGMSGRMGDAAGHGARARNNIEQVLVVGNVADGGKGMFSDDSV